MADKVGGVPDPAVEALVAAVEAEFGARLDADARAHIRRDCERLVANGRALSGQPLANGDEPDVVFAAGRGVGDGR